MHRQRVHRQRGAGWRVAGWRWEGWRGAGLAAAGARQAQSVHEASCTCAGRNFMACLRRVATTIRRRRRASTVLTETQAASRFGARHGAECRMRIIVDASARCGRNKASSGKILMSNPFRSAMGVANGPGVEILKALGSCRQPVLVWTPLLKHAKEPRMATSVAKRSSGVDVSCSIRL